MPTKFLSLPYNKFKKNTCGKIFFAVVKLTNTLDLEYSGSDTVPVQLPLLAYTIKPYEKRTIK